jgi:Site-specific recombinases, DNA invertase Pin homologs
MEQRKRVWIYCRIDAPEDAHGILKTQKKELLSYAEQMGFEVIGASNDLGSGLLLERPGLSECFEAAKAGKMDVLIIKSLSRIGRDTAGTSDFLRELNRCGVTLYSPLDGVFQYQGNEKNLSIQS